MSAENCIVRRTVPHVGRESDCPPDKARCLQRFRTSLIVRRTGAMSAENWIVRRTTAHVRRDFAHRPLCGAQAPCPQRTALSVEQCRMSAEISHSAHCSTHNCHVRRESDCPSNSAECWPRARTSRIVRRTGAMFAENWIVRRTTTHVGREFAPRPLCGAQSSCPQRLALFVEQRSISAESSHSVDCPPHMRHVCRDWHCPSNNASCRQRIRTTSIVRRTSAMSAREAACLPDTARCRSVFLEQETG